MNGVRPPPRPGTGKGAGLAAGGERGWGGGVGGERHVAAADAICGVSISGPSDGAAGAGGRGGGGGGGEGGGGEEKEEVHRWRTEGVGLGVYLVETIMGLMLLCFYS